MYIQITLKDLAANAFIKLKERNREAAITFADLDRYGKTIIERLKENGIKARLDIDRDSADRLFAACPEYFERYEENAGASGVRLKGGVTDEELWKAFREYLPVKILTAFADFKALQAAGIIST